MAQKEEYMKVISFLSDKGGVGKTSSVTTIGHMMAAIHKKKFCLLITIPRVIQVLFLQRQIFINCLQTS